MKIINDFEQGSLEWHRARCGLITMSHAKELMTGGRGKTRQGYIYDMLSERLSGEPVDGFSSIDMEKGNFLEPFAGQAFTRLTGLEIQRVGLVLHDDERIACSPDGLIDENTGIEIKCPKPRQHIRNMFSTGIDEYRLQCHGNMWITGRRHWFIVSFCPWVVDKPIFIKLINRDRSLIKAIELSAVAAANDLDRLVETVGLAKSPEEVRLIAETARNSWDNVLADNSEVRL